MQSPADAARLLPMPLPPSRLASSFFAFLVLAACESGGTHPLPGVPVAPTPAATAAALDAQVRQLALASRPGTRHAALAPLAGEWDVALSLISAAGDEAEPYRGHATLGWILGGRYMHWEATIDFAGTSGTTTGYLGFDTGRAEYELMMISDLSQAMEVAHGTGDLQGPGLVFTLERADPRSGSTVRARSRIRLLAADHFVLEQLEPGADGVDRTTRVWHYRKAPVTR